MNVCEPVVARQCRKTSSSPHSSSRRHDASQIARPCSLRVRIVRSQTRNLALLSFVIVASVNDRYVAGSLDDVKRLYIHRKINFRRYRTRKIALRFVNVASPRPRINIEVTSVCLRCRNNVDFGLCTRQTEQIVMLHPGITGATIINFSEKNNEQILV